MVEQAWFVAVLASQTQIKVYKYLVIIKYKHQGSIKRT
ncbi:hypothetical protein M23134_03028 [Microscilla marina ATCC 23134]|uniref:Uncharacterized protein n=1 Tax=Microscilla marina ATCC 23134 TaxID=313606 RepID=A2A037_MICM2|nr:hypothetical protein M23134_03028 [Microscilla marina ATCC 23134]